MKHLAGVVLRPMTCGIRSQPASIALVARARLPGFYVPKRFQDIALPIDATEVQHRGTYLFALTLRLEGRDHSVRVEGSQPKAGREEPTPNN